MATDTRTTEVLKDLGDLLTAPGDVSCAVAFITASGLAEVRDQLLQKLESGNQVRVLVDLQEGATDPSALWDLRAVSTEHSPRLQLRAYVPDRGILHSKLYMNLDGANGIVLTGSANLSFAALHENVEHGIRLSGAASDTVIRDATAQFEELWTSDSAFDIDDEAVRLYETYCGRRRAALTRSQRRSKAAWNSLVSHFSQGPSNVFHWPSPAAAYILGAITARGYLDPPSNKITIRLRFDPRRYASGHITVRDLSFEAQAVLPTIPEALAESGRLLFPDGSVSVEGNKITIDLSAIPHVFDEIEGLFVPATNCDSFHLPRNLAGEDLGVVTEFVRGFSVACGLLTDQTSMPGNPRTGLPGQMVVWLRPKQSNPELFSQLHELIIRRLGLTAYRHQRISRDPHIKILCEDFAEIGFGIEWWDRLVRRGAEHNESLFAKPATMNLFDDA